MERSGTHRIPNFSSLIRLGTLSTTCSFIASGAPAGGCIVLDVTEHRNSLKVDRQPTLLQVPWELLYILIDVLELGVGSMCSVDATHFFFRVIK